MGAALFAWLQENSMADWLKTLGRAAVSGTAASIASFLALAASAKVEGRDALRPVNATSHWLHGPEAAAVSDGDLAHTGLGYATHHAATLFWATLFEVWTARRPRTPLSLARDAAAVAAIAAAVDYLATPKRFTPGWEYVLSKRSMSLAYAALGAGLALGAYASDRHPMIRKLRPANLNR